MLHTAARRTGLMLAGLSLLIAGCASTKTLDDVRSTAEASQATLNRFMRDPEMTWLQRNLPRAKAVLISPSILQAGFIVGGSGGRCVVYSRTDGGRGWTGPAFYKIGTGSIGLQAGAEKAEMVTLVLTDKALNSLLSNSFKLGADVNIAAGPVGAGAGTPITADMVVYVRSKGLYGGLNLSGSVLKIDDSANQAFYGFPANPVDILVKQTATTALGNEFADQVARTAGPASR